MSPVQLLTTKPILRNHLLLQSFGITHGSPDAQALSSSKGGPLYLLFSLPECPFWQAPTHPSKPSLR